MTDFYNLEKHSPLINMAPLNLPSSGDQFDKNNIVEIVFLLLLDAMQVRQDSVMTQSKQVTDNAHEQNVLNDQNAAIHFSILPPNATQNKINEVQEQNQEYAAMRSNIQDKLITTRQEESVLLAQTSANIDLLQNDGSMNTGVVNLIGETGQEVASMTQGY